MKIVIRSILSTILFLSFFHGGFIDTLQSMAHAEEEWKQEYSEICAGTQNAMDYSTGELKSLIERCDKLLARIDGPDGLQTASAKKVYTKRLTMCRDLYEFALHHKEQTE